MPLLNSTREYLARPRVRPWALAGPVLVLLVALPLLRPLHHPDPNSMSDEETGRLATIAAMVEHHSLALDGLDTESDVTLPNHGLVRYRGRIFSDQPPTMAALLAAPYWVMFKLRLTLGRSPVLVAYLLTLIGVTLPVALAAGLIYKMARLFELPRPWRAGLAAAVVFGCGLISYSVVLSPYAPAAALVLACAGCLVYLAASPQPGGNLYWLILGGFCAALAAALDPPALIFLSLLPLVVLTLRWPPGRRMIGVGLFALGAIPPISLHFILNHRITGDWKPGFLHPELAVSRASAPPNGSARASSPRWVIVPAESSSSDDDEEPAITGWRAALRWMYRTSGCLLGGHGLLSHFPVLIFAPLGMDAVLRRHWPTSTKALAIVSALGAMAIVFDYAARVSDPRGAMFANKWFVVFLPLMFFWSGAWLRRPHRRAVWVTAGTLLAYSVIVSLIGAFDPLPRL